MILSGTSLRLSMPHCGCLSGKAPPLTAHRSELGDTLSIANSLLERLSKKEGDEEDEGQS